MGIYFAGADVPSGEFCLVSLPTLTNSVFNFPYVGSQISAHARPPQRSRQVLAAANSPIGFIATFVLSTCGLCQRYEEEWSLHHWSR